MSRNTPQLGDVQALFRLVGFPAEQGEGGGLHIEIAAVIVMPVLFFKAVLAGGHPVIIVTKPLLQCANVVFAQRIGGLQQGDGVNDVNQRAAINNADTASGIDAGNGLGMLQVGGHARFGIEEPGL